MRSGGLLAGSNTLYLCAPAHDQRRLTPLFVAVIRQIVEHVYDRVARTGRPLDPPLLVVLDEAANIAPLTDLDALAATAAGHGVQLVTVWHDLAQITARFGPRATTVVNNHRAKLFLSGISDPSTLDYASHLIGEELVHLPAVTHGARNPSSTTYSPSQRKLAPPDSLRRIAPGEGVLVYGALPPARLHLRSWGASGGVSDRLPRGPSGPSGHPASLPVDIGSAKFAELSDTDDNRSPLISWIDHKYVNSGKVISVRSLILRMKVRSLILRMKKPEAAGRCGRPAWLLAS